jgi:hypothetical protein
MRMCARILSAQVLIGALFSPALAQTSRKWPRTFALLNQHDETNCFDDTTLVFKKNGRGHDSITMADLKVGDSILDGDGNYTRVVSIVHKEEKIETEVLTFYSVANDLPAFDVSQEILRVSPLQLLFNRAGKTRLAYTFKAGDYLRDAEGNAIEIYEIRAENKFVRMIAPTTASGTILVRAHTRAPSVKVSCYASFPHQTLSHFYWKLKFFSGFFCKT